MLAAFAVSLCASAAPAQRAPTWVAVSPKGEGFVAWMPKQPPPQPQQVVADGTLVSGRRYEVAGDDQSTYIVWSLNDSSNVGERLSRVEYVSAVFHGEALYLDLIAKFAWNMLVTPEIERLKKEKPAKDWGVNPGMEYKREFALAGRPAREYFVRLEKASGPLYVCADGPRIYIVVALGADSQSPLLRQFVESFGFNGVMRASRLPGPATIDLDPALIKPDQRERPYSLPNSSANAPTYGQGSGSGNAGGASVDNNRPLKPSEVTRKATITFKPEPAFTEDARNFNVTGVIRIRAVLNWTGKITGISVVKGLPHGLTWQALDALKRIRFEPAQKDGHAVSQYATFEYNFNIY